MSNCIFQHSTIKFNLNAGKYLAEFDTSDEGCEAWTLGMERENGKGFRGGKKSEEAERNVVFTLPCLDNDYKGICA